MKQAAKIFTALIALFSICFAFGGCIFSCNEYYYDYHVIWYCDDPYIVFQGDRYYGFMELDGKNYMLDIASMAHGSTIYFYDESKMENGAIREEFLIWEADTEIKDGQLFLTILKDNISDYEGKTIVFNQRPVEDDNY